MRSFVARGATPVLALTAVFGCGLTLPLVNVAGGRVEHAVLSPDGRYFAQSTNLGTTVSEVETGKGWKELKGAAASDLRFSADSKFLASGGLTELVLWDCGGGKPLATWNGRNRWSFKMAFSRDGSLLAARDDTSVRVWDTAGRDLVLEIPMPYEADGLAFSPDGKLLAIAGSEKKADEPRGHEVKVWEVPGGELLATLRGPEYCIVKSLAFSPDGEHLATGLSVQAARLWAVSAGKEVWKQEVGNVDYDVLAYSADGKQLIVGGHQSLCRLDAANGTVLKRYELPGGSITSLATTADPARLLVARERSVDSLDLESGKERRLLSR